MPRGHSMAPRVGRTSAVENRLSSLLSLLKHSMWLYVGRPYRLDPAGAISAILCHSSAHPAASAAFCTKNPLSSHCPSTLMSLW